MQNICFEDTVEKNNLYTILGLRLSRHGAIYLTDIKSPGSFSFHYCSIYNVGSTIISIHWKEILYFGKLSSLPKVKLLVT